MSDKQVQHTVDEHYVPEFILKNFCLHKCKAPYKNDRMVIYDPQHDRISQKSPGQVFYRKHLYETEWHYKKDASSYISQNDIENHFSTLEKAFAETVEKVLLVCSESSNQNCLVCTSSEIGTLRRMAANLYLRHPKILEWKYREHLESLDTSDENHIAVNKIFKYMEFEDAEAIDRVSIKYAWLDDRIAGSMPHTVVSDLQKMRPTFLVASDRKFISGGLPVSFTFRGEGISEMRVPLSPTCMLVFGDSDLVKKHRNRKWEIGNDAVDIINSLTIAFQRQVSEKWFAAQKEDILLAKDAYELLRRVHKSELDAFELKADQFLAPQSDALSKNID